MKIAISGKGGVGKTTFAANLAFWLSEHGIQVLAVDADPDSSLGTVLGFSDNILQDLKPIVDMKDLIEERMGGSGAFYPLNPNVDDILYDYSISRGAIRFFRMGNIKGGGTSCYCKENSFLHALINSLILGEEDTVILDMGAGIEQLTRGTAQGVDILIIVTEASTVSIHTVQIIQKLAFELGIKKVFVVGNKIRNSKEENFLKNQIQDEVLLGIIPFSEQLLDMSVDIIHNSLPNGTPGFYLQNIFKKIVEEGR